MPGNLPKEEVSLEAERASLNVKDIVSIARKNFIPGNNIRGGVKSIASQLMGPSRPFRRADKKMWYDKDNGQCFEIKADQDKDELKLSLGETFHIVDPRFTGYVNVVYDTNFTLGEGPRGDKEKVSQLLANTIDNPEFPIKNIFALGAYTGRMGGYIDFYPYFVKKQSDGLGRQRQRFEDLGQYQLIVKENRGEATAVGLNKDDYVHHEPLSSKITVIKKNPLGSQEEETLHVELINLIDGQGIPSENLNQNDLLKNKLLQLFEISQHKKVYVHCQAGIGRTGHLVLTFLLLKYAKDIFFTKDPETAAKNCHILLSLMRENRLCVVHTPEQFSLAIQNAAILAEHALKVGYTIEPEISLEQIEKNLKARQEALKTQSMKSKFLEEKTKIAESREEKLSPEINSEFLSEKLETLIQSHSYDELGFCLKHPDFKLEENYLIRIRENILKNLKIDYLSDINELLKYLPKNLANEIFYVSETNILAQRISNELVTKIIATGIPAVKFQSTVNPELFALQLQYDEVKQALGNLWITLAKENQKQKMLELIPLLPEKYFKEFILNYQDEAGFTALHWAATLAHTPLVETLVFKGADLTIAAKDGSIPILLVAQGKALRQTIQEDIGLYIKTCEKEQKSPSARLRALGKLKACVTNTLEIKEIDQLMAGFESLDQVIQSMKKLSICTRLNKMFDYAYEEYSKDPSVENSLKLQDSLISLPKITSSHVNLFEHEIQRKELGELDRIKGLVAENQRQKFCF